VNIEDQVAVLFARANPVPSLDLLDPIDPVDIGALRDESERSSAMSEVKTIEPKREGSDRRRFAPGLALAGVMVVVAVAAFALANRSPAPVAGPVGIAEAYMFAMNEHDVDTVLSLLADDAVVESDWDQTNLGELPARIEFERIIGMTYHWDACSEDASGQVRCPYQGSDHLSRALGVGLSGANRFEFTIEDGMIEHVVNFERQGLRSDARVAETIEPFGAWVLENHPADYAAIFEPPLWRAEPMALWEKYVPEFVASLEG
jgi:hypothetical protein